MVAPFGKPQPQNQGPPPEVVKIMEEMKVKNRAIDARLQETQMRIRSEEARNHEDNTTAKQIAEIRERGNIVRTATSVHQAREARSHDAEQAGENRKHKVAEIIAGRDAKATMQKPAASQQKQASGMPSSEQLMELLVGMKQRTDAIEDALKAIVAHMVQSGGPRPPMGMMPNGGPGAPMGMQPA